MIMILFKTSWHTHWEPLMLMSSPHLQKFLLGLTKLNAEPSNVTPSYHQWHMQQQFFNPYCINPPNVCSSRPVPLYTDPSFEAPKSHLYLAWKQSLSFFMAANKMLVNHKTILTQNVTTVYFITFSVFKIKIKFSYFLNQI